MLRFRDDEKLKRASKRNWRKNKKSFADRNTRSNSWSKNEDFIAKAQRLYKLQTLTSREQWKEGKWEREKRKKCRGKRENCATGSAIEAFARFSNEIWLKMHLKFECNLRISALLASEKIWDSPKMEERCKLVVDGNCNAKVNVVVELRIAMITRRKCCDKQRNTKNRHVFPRIGAVTRRAFLSRTCNSFFVCATKSHRSWLLQLHQRRLKAQQQLEWSLSSRKWVGGKFLRLCCRPNVKIESRLNGIINHSDPDFLADALKLFLVIIHLDWEWLSCSSGWLKRNENCWHTRHIEHHRVRRSTTLAGQLCGLKNQKKCHSAIIKSKLRCCWTFASRRAHVLPLSFRRWLRWWNFNEAHVALFAQKIFSIMDFEVLFHHRGWTFTFNWWFRAIIKSLTCVMSVLFLMERVKIVMRYGGFIVWMFYWKFKMLKNKRKFQKNFIDFHSRLSFYAPAVDLA